MHACAGMVAGIVTGGDRQFYTCNAAVNGTSSSIGNCEKNVGCSPHGLCVPLTQAANPFTLQVYTDHCGAPLPGQVGGSGVLVLFE